MGHCAIIALAVWPVGTGEDLAAVAAVLAWALFVSHQRAPLPDQLCGGCRSSQEPPAGESDQGFKNCKSDDDQHRRIGGRAGFG
ncbi:MAG: hypothetical protein GY927_11525 [bacterium]|nr:hypothetical protein [bacterium]